MGRHLLFYSMQFSVGACLVVCAAAFNAPLSARPVVTQRTGSITLAGPALPVTSIATNQIGVDQDGIMEASQIAEKKPPIKLLSRLDDLELLTALSEAGLLSAAENAGVFSKLEAAGAFSTAEKLLPLADQLKLLSTAEKLINVESSILTTAAAALLIGEIGLLAVVPDDNQALVALQVATGLLAGLASVTLFSAASLFSVLQGDD